MVAAGSGSSSDGSLPDALACDRLVRLIQGMLGRPPILLLWCCAVAGCYIYRPLAAPQPEPATYLAVTLTEAGSEDLARYIGPDVRVVRGRFQSTSERGLTVSVSQVELRRGDVLSWQGESVVVPRAFVASLEERRVSRGRNVLLARGSHPALLASYQAFGSAGGGVPAPAGPGMPR